MNPLEFLGVLEGLLLAQGRVDRGPLGLDHPARRAMQYEAVIGELVPDVQGIRPFHDGRREVSVQLLDDLLWVAQIPPGQPQVGVNELAPGFGLGQGHGQHPSNEFGDRLAATP